jgi:glycosyltransferase involved in cell wall biosynthesis
VSQAANTLDGESIRLLHVAETLTGGIATYLNEILLVQQREYGASNVHVLAPAEQLAQLRGLPAAGLHGFERAGRNAGSLWRLAVLLLRCCRDLRPTIVHLHSSFAGTVGRLLGPWLAGRPRLVYCPHGWAFARDDRAWLRKAYGLMEKLLANRADAWVAISRHEIEIAGQYGIPLAHSKVILNGVGDTTQTTEQPDLIDKGRQINLLFVGRHDRQKGLDLLLSAMKGVDPAQAKLFIAGASVLSVGDEKMDQPNMVWLGWQAPEALRVWYRACDAVIVPSRWEGFGLVAVEAMREGKPVLASRVGGLPEIVDDGKTGQLFEPNAGSIRQLIQGLRPQALQAWGVQGRRRYLENFTSERMNMQLNSLYRSLL